MSFLGAAQNVTGSCYLLEIDGRKVLVDCGLYQERAFRYRNWDPFVVPPANLDAVLLTHAHVDHCGLLPKLVREGFRGRIYCTHVTAGITKIALLDAAKLQQEDAEFKKKRHRREGRRGPHAEVPLYTTEDAEACLPLFEDVTYGEEVELDKGISASFHNAGHIFGSSMVKVKVRIRGLSRTILFSGDVGRWNKPMLDNPELVDQADYVLVESTYGDRLHSDPGSISDSLAEIVNSTVEAGGNIVVPTFAIERAQEVLYYLNELLISGKIPPLLVLMDSPMAIKVTDVFSDHPELLDRKTRTIIKAGNSPFSFPGLTMVRTTEESKAINAIKGTTMIVAGSGMCTGGRVKHHLVTNISKPQSTILFVGYQAMGTLGRTIVDGAREVRILGQTYPVRARLAQLHGFSAHADREELHRWLSGLKDPPRQTFVVHGEAEAAKRFSGFLRERTGWTVSVPAYKDHVVLN